MRTLLALVLVAVGCAACRARPLDVPGPLTVAPSAVLVTPSGQPAADAACTTPRLSSGGSVDPDPTGVQLAWLPGVNSRTCRSVQVRGSEVQARRLAHDIDHLPSWPDGPMSCPNDDGAAVELVFAYRGHRYEQVVVQLSGCAGVAGALRADLRPLAPVGWRQYLQP